uniref:Uncharacterized protein n=1 Tax=Romanomermis culicivorax TaxID=13658 RepID=A0A915I2J3_ROMCU
MDDLTNNVRSAHDEYLKPKSVSLIVRGKNATSAENVAYFLEKIGGIEVKADNALKLGIRADVSIEMPHVFIRVISAQTRKIRIFVNFPYDQQYNEYKFEHWLASALHHNEFQEDNEDLTRGSASVTFSPLNPIIVVKAKTHFQLVIQITLTEKGVFEHERVLISLAQHLNSIHKYSESDWAEIRSKYTQISGNKINSNLAECVRNSDLENSIVKAIKPQFNLNFQRSGIEFLIESNYSYVLSAPIPKDANVSSFTVLPSISYNIEPNLLPNMKSIQIKTESLNRFIIPRGTVYQEKVVTQCQKV